MSWIKVERQPESHKHDYPPLRTVKHVAPGSIYECSCGDRFIVEKGVFFRRYRKMRAWPGKPKPPPPPRTRIP